MQNILIVDDNLYLSRVVHHLLLAQDLGSQSAFTLAQAFSCLERHTYDLLIIDRMLPDGDGLEILDYLAEIRCETPILIISDKGQLEERIKGLEKGADDYLPKPFSMEEFRLRVDRLLSRSKSLIRRGIRAGPLMLYPGTGEVIAAEKHLPFRRKEFEILYFLAKHQNNIVSREMLVENIWPPQDMPSFATIDVYIRRIRLLLGKYCYLLKTLRGYGYMMRTDESVLPEVNAAVRKILQKQLEKEKKVKPVVQQKEMEPLLQQQESLPQLFSPAQ